MVIKKFLFNLFKTELVLSMWPLVKVKGTIAVSFKVKSGALMMSSLTHSCMLNPQLRGMCTIAGWDNPKWDNNRDDHREDHINYKKQLLAVKQSGGSGYKKEWFSPPRTDAIPKHLREKVEKFKYEESLSNFDHKINAEILEHNDAVLKFYKENLIDVEHCLYQKQLGHYVVKRYYFLGDKLYQLTYILTTNPNVSKDIKAIAIPEGRLDGKEGLQMVCPIPFISEIGILPYLPHGGRLKGILEKPIKDKFSLESLEKFHHSFDKAILKSYESNTYIKVFEKRGYLNEIKDMPTKELMKGYVSAEKLERIGLKNMDLYSFHEKKTLDRVLNYLRNESKIVGGAVSADNSDSLDSLDS